MLGQKRPKDLQKRKESLKSRIKNIMNLNKSLSFNASHEFVEERRFKIFTVLGLEMVAKLIHLIIVFSILASDL